MVARLHGCASSSPRATGSLDVEAETMIGHSGQGLHLPVADGVSSAQHRIQLQPEEGR
jgi:hypothetical protein